MRVWVGEWGKRIITTSIFFSYDFKFKMSYFRVLCLSHRIALQLWCIAVVTFLTSSSIKRVESRVIVIDKCACTALSSSAADEICLCLLSTDPLPVYSQLLSSPRTTIEAAWSSNKWWSTVVMRVTWGEYVTMATQIPSLIAFGTKRRKNRRVLRAKSPAVPFHFPKVCSQIKVSSKSIARKLMPIDLKWVTTCWT